MELARREGRTLCRVPVMSINSTLGGVRAMCGGLRHADVLVSDAWIDGLELLQEGSDGKAIWRKVSIEQEGLGALRHGWRYVSSTGLVVLITKYV